MGRAAASSVRSEARNRAAHPADRHPHQHPAAVSGHISDRPLVITVHASGRRPAARARHHPVLSPGPHHDHLARILDILDDRPPLERRPHRRLALARLSTIPAAKEQPTITPALTAADSRSSRPAGPCPAGQARRATHLRPSLQATRPPAPERAFPARHALTPAATTSLPPLADPAHPPQTLLWSVRARPHPPPGTNHKAAPAGRTDPSRTPFGVKPTHRAMLQSVIRKQEDARPPSRFKAAAPAPAYAQRDSPHALRD